MNRLFRLVLAAIAGLVLGSVVNMALVMVGGVVLPPPSMGAVQGMEGLKAALPLYEPHHFIFPFLAHAVGTLVGAAAACWLSPGGHRGPAWAVGVVFLIGGAVNVALLPSPIGFAVLDLGAAYLPMAWLAIRFMERRP